MFTYTKIRRRTGGHKVCTACGKVNPVWVKLDGLPRRPKDCVECGAKLPRKYTYDGRASRQWYVRQRDRLTDRVMEYQAESSQAADELIRELQSEEGLTETQRLLVEHVRGLVRAIQIEDFEQAVTELIDLLGGDATARKLQPLSMQEFITRVTTDMGERLDLAPGYVQDVKRVLADLVAIARVHKTTEITPQSICQFHRRLKTGDWSRPGRRVKPQGKRSVRRALATVRAALARGAELGHVSPAVLSADVWSQAVDPLEHAYMPDTELVALVTAAGTTEIPRFWRAAILTAYNAAMRRQDVLALRWADVDLDGSQAEALGMLGPSIRAENRKARRPRRVPLHPAAIAALTDLQAHPEAHRAPKYPRSAGLVSDRVFPVFGYERPDSAMTKAFRLLCIEARLVDGEGKAKWGLHDLRRKANDDAGRAHATVREQMALSGHSSMAVNVQHYQTVDQGRMRDLILGNAALGAIGA